MCSNFVLWGSKTIHSLRSRHIGYTVILDGVSLGTMKELPPERLPQNNSGSPHIE